jgi:hypothetical protein
MAWKRQRVRLIKPSEADSATAEIFAEIQRALGVPQVNMIFQVFASYQGFLPLFWRAASPLVDTQEFFDSANRLGAEAYTRTHNYFAVPDLRCKVEEMHFSSGAQEELKEVVELYHYNNPLLLLLCAALIQSFENPDANPRPGTPVNNRPDRHARIILVEEENAPPPTRRIYDDIKRTMNMPFLNTSYFNFGRWPDFLCEYWNALKPLVGTPLYEQHRRAMRDSALTMAAELPMPLQLSTAELEENGVSREELSSIVQTTESFLDALSKQVLNIAYAKIGLEGGVRSKVAA